MEAYALDTAGEGFQWTPDIPLPHTVTTIVRVFTEDGLDGVGATASYSPRASDFSVLETLGPLALCVLTRPASQFELFAREFDRLPLPIAPGARSALDVALWDLAAKRAGIPLFEYLGGAPRPLRAYASSPFLGKLDAYIEAIGEWRAAGFRAVKLHTWCEPARDLELVRTVASTYADGSIDFMLDVEQAYDRASALRVAREMSRLGWTWLEAPLPDHDLSGYRELRSRVEVPILCSGNWIWRLPEVLTALRAQAWDAVHFDVTVAGGITAGRKLAVLAEAAGLGIELQSWGHPVIQAANLHLAVASGRARYFEITVPSVGNQGAVRNPVRIDGDGLVHAPCLPGLGIELDWEAVTKSAVAARTWSA